VAIESAANGNCVGTASDGIDDSAAELNLISGNQGDGIGLFSVTGTIVAGNYIGTDLTGTKVPGNTGSGVKVSNSPNTRIGTNSDGYNDALEGNLISGNASFGVYLYGAATTGTLVAGNKIGTTAAGTSGLPNAKDGVGIDSGVSQSMIGGTAAGAGNIIAFNVGRGVNLFGGAGAGNAIETNLIFGNGSLGIDLGNDGVTGNDSHSHNSGPNNWQNTPVLNNVTVLGSSDALSFSFSNSSTPNMVYRFEFYANPAKDPSGSGQGMVFLGYVYVLLDGNGNASVATFDYTPIKGMGVISATATDANGNTSEFSVDFQNTVS